MRIGEGGPGYGVKAGLRDCASQADLQKYPNMKHLAVCDAKRATN